MVNIPIERLPAENKKDGLSVGYRIHYPMGCPCISPAAGRRTHLIWRVCFLESASG
jgi:hypothetical protein